MPKPIISKRFPWGAIVVLIICSLRTGALFLAGLMLASIIATCLPGPFENPGDYERHSAFLRIGWWGCRLDFDAYMASLLVRWASIGHALSSAYPAGKHAEDGSDAEGTVQAG